jgi:hypothetical protein
MAKKKNQPPKQSTAIKVFYRINGEVQEPVEVTVPYEDLEHARSGKINAITFIARLTTKVLDDQGYLGPRLTAEDLVEDFWNVV